MSVVNGIFIALLLLSFRC